MAPAFVVPTTANQTTPYTVHDSTAFICAVTSSIDAAATDVLLLTYPAGLAGVAVTLEYVAPDGERPPPLVLKTTGNGAGTVAHFGVSTEVGDPSGGIVQLTVQITDDGRGFLEGEFWELRASADVAALWTFQAPDGSAVFRPLDVQWLAVDPVAEVTVPATAFEQEKVTITAELANPPGTVVGKLPNGLKAAYTWEHTGSLPITGLPTITEDPSTTFDLPGVYDPVPVPMTVTTTFADAANIYTGFVQTRSAPGTMTVTQRPQQIVLVIDRSGSMSLENRYDNAKAACRVLVHLFNGLREGVNAGDRVAIVAFEDGTFGFRGGEPSPLIQTLLPLTPLEDAVDAIDHGTVDFGGPGTNTPIGDGLLAAIDLLAAAGPIIDQRYLVFLLSDGDENSGHTTLDPARAVNGAIPFTTAISALNPLRKAIVDQTRISTIALGPTAIPGQMQKLATEFRGRFAHVNDVSQLAAEFGHLLETPPQSINQLSVRTTPTNPDGSDPDAAQFPPGNAIYLSTNDDDDRLVLSVLPPAGSTVMTDTIQLARWNGAAYDAVTTSILASESDRSTSVSKLAESANKLPIHWRVIHGTGPAAAHELREAQVLAYADLHLLADVILDKPIYGTGDRMTLTVRIRHDAAPVLGCTIRAVLTAPDVGLGDALSGIGDIPDDDTAKNQKDRRTWLERRIDALLARRNWRHLPHSQPPPTGVFVDNTDQLFDPDGDGNYTNTFARVFKEGTYAWQLFVEGLNANGNPFSRTLNISTFAAVTVDPRETKIKVTRVHNHPSKLLAARVIVTPRDARDERLGPGKDNVVVWSVRDGDFEHVVNHEPAPVFAEGSYQRVILYRPTQRPRVTVKASRVLLPTIDIRRALLGFGDLDDESTADESS